MALSKSNLLIRDYDNIRDILRNMYIFGCFTRDDYIEMGYGEGQIYCSYHAQELGWKKKGHSTSKSAGNSFDPADYDDEDDFAEDAFGEDFGSYEDAVETWEND